MNNELQNQFASLISLTQKLRKEVADTKLIDKLEIEIIQLSEMLSSDTFNSPHALETQTDMYNTQNDTHKSYNNTNQSEAKTTVNVPLVSVKAKLALIDDVLRDLEYQKANKSNLENQQKSVNLSISYVTRKQKYYLSKLETLNSSTNI